MPVSIFPRMQLKKDECTVRHHISAHKSAILAPHSCVQISIDAHDAARLFVSGVCVSIVYMGCFSVQNPGCAVSPFNDLMNNRILSRGTWSC